ncbi:hypothetical protein Gpo141_00006795 [Globisporangium polare]
MKSFVAATTKWLALALALSWTAACADAAIIKASGITAPASDLGQFQTLEKTWSVSGSTALRNLLVHAPGLVYVDYDASLDSNGPEGLIAKVVLTGDSEDLLNAFDVVSLDEPTGEGFELRFLTLVGHFRGHLLTQILVGSKQMLQNFKSVSSADVVISDNVLKSDDEAVDLKFSLFGSGDVTVVSTQKLYVGTLSVLATASGDLEVQAPLIEATKSISVNAHGSGDVALIAEEIKTDVVTTKSTASGDVYVQADNVIANTIDTLISGSGDVTFSRGGKCTTQNVKVTASGCFASGSIISEFADVSIFGSGDALVQATDKLVATITASGDIHYVNDEPKEVVVRGRSASPSHRGRHGPKVKKIKQAHKNEFDTYKPYVPRQERTPQLVMITRSTNNGRFVFSDDDDSFDEGGIVIVSDDSYDFADVENLAAASPSTGRAGTPLVISGYVGVFMGVIGLVAVYKFRQQRRRAEYSPLIAVTTSAD